MLYAVALSPARLIVPWISELVDMTFNDWVMFRGANMYRLLVYTTGNDKSMIGILAHPGVPQDIMELSLISYYRCVAGKI
jgi:hypothetical protein